jgi:hypothetical protein
LCWSSIARISTHLCSLKLREWYVDTRDEKLDPGKMKLFAVGQTLILATLNEVDQLLRTISVPLSPRLKMDRNLPRVLKSHQLPLPNVR